MCHLLRHTHLHVKWQVVLLILVERGELCADILQCHTKGETLSLVVEPIGFASDDQRTRW